MIIASNNYEYCPDCIIELKKQSKKIGNQSVWMVCPICGFRKRPESNYTIQKEFNQFYDNKKRINSNDNSII